MRAPPTLAPMCLLLALLGCEEAESPPVAAPEGAAELEPAPAAPPEPGLAPPPAPAPSAFRPDAPYTLELGRGSGRMGLQTVTVDPEGAVVVYEMRTVASRRGTEMHWERAELTLDEAQRAELAQLVIRHRLLELDAEYQEPGVMDGTQWLLRLQQAPRDHIVYCDNRFPPELRDFATELDDLLDGAGLPAAGFTRPPDREQGGHDRALWDALYASRGDAE